MTDDEITGEPLGFPKQKLLAITFFFAGLVFAAVWSYQLSFEETLNEVAVGLAVLCFICSIFFNYFKGF